VLWPFLQIIQLDLFEWFQWLGNVSKPIRITLESRKIKSNGEKSNNEKIPFLTHIHLANFAKLQSRPPLLAPLLVKHLYIKNKPFCIKQTQFKSKKNSNSTYM
jgi:hypothetical protein